MVKHEGLILEIYSDLNPLCLNLSFSRLYCWKAALSLETRYFFAGQNPQLGSPVGVFDGVGGKQFPKSRITHIKVVLKVVFRMGRAEGAPATSGDPQF